MKFLKCLLIVFFFLPPGMKSQGIVPLSITDIPQAMIDRAGTYDGESLWGYMDGGADIYLEYGFQSLLVQELTWNHEKLRLEVYLMQTPEGAFGIYSTSVIKCMQYDTLSPYDCVSRFQYQLAYGNLYIAITSESGSAAARQLFFPIARILIQKNPQTTLKLPEVFTRNQLLDNRKNLVYLQGSLGLQNSLFPWQDLFLDVHFGMYAIMIPNPESDIYFAQITFPSPADRLRFLTAAGLVKQLIPVPNVTTSEGLYHAFMQADSTAIYFLESQEPYPIDALIRKKEKL